MYWSSNMALRCSCVANAMVVNCSSKKTSTGLIIYRNFERQIQLGGWTTEWFTLYLLMLEACPKDTVKQFDKKTKAITITRPYPNYQYNSFMSGVDTIYKTIDHFHFALKSKKWYLRVFFYPINGPLVKGWLCHKSSIDNLMDLMSVSPGHPGAEISQNWSLAPKNSINRGKTMTLYRFP